MTPLAFVLSQRIRARAGLHWAPLALHPAVHAATHRCRVCPR